MEALPIPVTIIAGSFSAGKTTLCNELLGPLAASGASVAVISHRFAEECLSWVLLLGVDILVAGGANVVSKLKSLHWSPGTPRNNRRTYCKLRG